jgi:hypothetical protein
MADEWGKNLRSDTRVVLDGEVVSGAETGVAEPTTPGPPPAITVGSVSRAWRTLVSTVAEHLDSRPRIWALETGAGERTLFDLPEDAYIVGVDRDADALHRNTRLDERVVADLADYRPWAAGFDLVTAWYVLEDLADAAAVLDRIAGWTAPGGLVVIGVPNLRSPRGLWSRLRGRHRLRRALTPQTLRRRFIDNGFTPVLQVFFEDSGQASRRRRLLVTRKRWKAVQVAVRVLSFGLLDAARTDLIAVFRRDD